MSDRWRAAHLSELEALALEEEGLTWYPVRRSLGVDAFGIGAYTAAGPGDCLVPEHREESGHEEVYVVVGGRARFTLEGEEVEAPAGTFVHVRPGVLRSAVGLERGTTVLAVGAEPGVAFKPSGWEWGTVGAAYQRQGRVEEALAVAREGVELYGDAWQSHYNLACAFSLAGHRDEALSELARAVELGGEGVRDHARRDSDLDAVRDDPRFSG